MARATIFPMPMVWRSRPVDRLTSLIGRNTAQVHTPRQDALVQEALGSGSPLAQETFWLRKPWPAPARPDRLRRRRWWKSATSAYRAAASARARARAG